MVDGACPHCQKKRGIKREAVKVLLTSWFKSRTGFTLRVYWGVKPKYSYTERFIEISTFKGQAIATKLIQKYAASLKLSTFNIRRSLRMAVEAELPDAAAERLLFALKKLGEIPCSSKIPDKLAENPTIEKVERFLSIRKLLRGAHICPPSN